MYAVGGHADGLRGISMDEGVSAVSGAYRWIRRLWEGMPAPALKASQQELNNQTSGVFKEVILNKCIYLCFPRNPSKTIL